MQLIGGKQISEVEDPVRAKLAMVVPILKATLHSLARDRIERLGGLARVTLHDLAREFREGHGDAGICFEPDRSSLLLPSPIACANRATGFKHPYRAI